MDELGKRGGVYAQPEGLYTDQHLNVVEIFSD